MYHPLELRVAPQARGFAAGGFDLSYYLHEDTYTGI
jgi:hypothetical protein